MLLFGLGLGSRRSADNDLRDLELAILHNLNLLAGTQQESLPVTKTLDRFTSHTPNRFYVFDSANSRILGFYGFRPAYPDGTFPPADLVIGQPNGWDHGAANGCNTRANVAPTDRTLALLPFPNVASTAESPSSGMMATDAQGNFYVADECNNRVFKFNDPFATDSIADDVWGQTSFTNRSIPATPSACSLNMNRVFSAGVEVDTANNLWVADSGNSRVLRFRKGPPRVGQRLRRCRCPPPWTTAAGWATWAS